FHVRSHHPDQRLPVRNHHGRAEHRRDRARLPRLLVRRPVPEKATAAPPRLNGRAHPPLKILITSASIGEGHDLPARVLTEGIRAERPDADVQTVDTIAIVGPLLRRIIMDSSRFHSRVGSRIFDLLHRLITDVAPTRWLAGKGGELLGRGRILQAVERARPDVGVSTYPGSTEILGRLPQRGDLAVPVVSAITDLAALRYWAHPGVDLHLITHPESAAEVAEIAPRSETVCVRGLTDARFYAPRDRENAREELGLPPDGPVALVSGGGWAI